MGILYSILIGGIAGWLGSTIMESHNSMIVNILLGIVGGVVGGFVAKRLGNDPSNDGTVMQILIAAVGAIILIFLGRLF